MSALVKAETVTDLLLQVPEGETRLFKHIIDDDLNRRFFSVHQNQNYQPSRLDWLNGNFKLGSGPWFGARQKKRISVFSVPEPEIRFQGPTTSLIDFYSTGSHAFIISDRLANLIESLDPGSLESRPVTINAKGGEVSYNLVMPSRVLEAVDISRTDVLIKNQQFGSARWFRSVQFLNGVRFRDDLTSGVHSFSDIDALGWVWSRDLIDAAKPAGVRGLYTRVPYATGPDVDRL